MLNIFPATVNRFAVCSPITYKNNAIPKSYRYLTLLELLYPSLAYHKLNTRAQALKPP